ncbi:anti-phage ZorAB system protein ZorA [Spiribacter sp. 218]|uniref:anti-phage ZorAB system protein ZorA n=1 Tax=Spiribacter pallidus TaxID=1987936 RepID=UPI00349F2ABB
MEFSNFVGLARIGSAVTSPEGIIVIAGVIALWAFLAARRLGKRLRPLSEDLARCVDALKKTNTEREFAEHFHDLSEQFNESVVLRHAWSEFTETLIFPDIDQEDAQDIRIRNTTAPERFFNRANLLEPRVNLRFYSAMPNLLTGTGILGTFIGLVIGIGQASGGLASDDVRQAQEALSALLGGAALAFMTSIAGLISSIAFSLWEKRRIYHFDQLCNEWVEELDHRLVRVTQEGLTGESIYELKQQRAALEHFGNDLAFQISEALDNRVTAKLSPVLERVVTEIEGMRSEQRHASDETLERLLSQFSESISSAAGEEMRAFAGTVEQMGQSLEKQVHAMSSSHEQMQVASQRTIQELSETFRDSSRQLNEELSSAVKGLVTEISQTVADMTKELRAATETTTSNMEQIVERFDESVAKLRQSIMDIREMTTNTQSLNEQMTELLAAIDSSHRSIEGLKEPLGQAGNVFEAAGTKIEGAVGQVASSSTEIAEASGQLSDAQTRTVELWRGYQERFEKIDESLEAVFSQLQDGLAGYADSTNRYVQGLDEHASSVVKQLAGAVRQLEEAIEEFSSQANESE